MKPLFNVLAVFKNEARALPEWIEHYLEQGADKIILINNNSTDNWEERCKPYMHHSHVIFREDNRKWAQVEIYNDTFKDIGHESIFLLVCDLDEFMYAQNNYKTIKDYLHYAKKMDIRGCIKIPWKNFGSSGHKKHPKGGIVKNFTYRKHYNEKSVTNVKYICRTKDVASLGVHLPKLVNGNYYNTSLEITDNQPIVLIDEEILKFESLVINHYAIQSEEYFREVKMTRGDAHNPRAEKVRNMRYFEAYDVNQLLDEALFCLASEKRIKQKKRISLEKFYPSMPDSADNSARSTRFDSRQVTDKKACVKLVAIAKDEGAYIPQWIYHHFSQGIDLIEIHINNTTDNSLKICKKISKNDKRLTYFKGDKLFRKCQSIGKNYQEAAYNQSYKRSLRCHDNATHLLFLDLDEYLINRQQKKCIMDLIHAHPEADVISLLWYFETWDNNKKTFANPILSNAEGIRNPHVKSLVKVSRKVKSCRHHNARFKDNYSPTNFLSDTNIKLVEGENSYHMRALVNNEVLHNLDKQETEGWAVLHCVYRSETEYLASLIRARAHNNHSDPIKDNRWGLKNPAGDIIPLSRTKSKILYQINYAIFLVKHRLFNELRRAQEKVINRRQRLNELLNSQPDIVVKYSKVFAGTQYQINDQ